MQHLNVDNYDAKLIDTFLKRDDSYMSSFGQQNRQESINMGNLFENPQEVGLQRQVSGPSFSMFDVVLNHVPDVENELLQSVPVMLDANGNIVMSSVLSALKNRNYNLDRVMVYYYSETSLLYVYCGKVAEIGENVVIPAQDVIEGKMIKLRFRHFDFDESRSMISTPQEVNNNNYNNNNNNNNNYNNCSQSQSQPFENNQSILDDQNMPTDFDEECKTLASSERGDTTPSRANKIKRITKDRSIGEVMELIKRWRSLYNKNDVQNSTRTNHAKSMTLQDAAVHIGVPKKTLDDYFLIIKKAQALNFDFNANQDQRFGIVRSFVKRQKGKVKRDQSPDESNNKKKISSSSKKIK
mmetsp:Transcript_23700/g.20586  ORF Transcript_23700/g.20586 Transcript_23700/m.20586 type:complete len:354 (+) Transcript_23700:294-1355(+)